MGRLEGLVTGGGWLGEAQGGRGGGWACLLVQQDCPQPITQQVGGVGVPDWAGWEGRSKEEGG